MIQPPTMPSAMERLPVELVDMMISHMPLSDRMALRLVSKQLLSLTLATFSRDYFSKRTTTLGIPSMNRLVAASAHPTFSSSVTLLDIKLLDPEDYQNLLEIDRVGRYPPPKRLRPVSHVKMEDIRLESKLPDYMHTHDEPKDVIHPLSRALKRFPNLKTVRFRVYGLTVYGAYDTEQELYQTFLSACFKAVLDAIVRSNVKLEEFTLIKGTSIRPKSKSANLNYLAFSFPFPYLVSLQTIFSSLRRLRLSILTDYNGNARIPGWENGVSQFISVAPALEELALGFNDHDKPRFKSAVMHSICHTLELPMLKSFQLYGSAVDELDLIAFLKSHSSTLRSLHWRDTVLQTGTWVSVLSIIKQDLSLDYLRFEGLCHGGASLAWLDWCIDYKKKGSKLAVDIRKSRDRELLKKKLSDAIASLNSSIAMYNA